MKTTKYVIAVSLAVALLAPSAFAQSTVDVKAQIAEILAKIQQLQAQLKVLQSQQPATAWCHTFNTNLGVGSRGAEAAALHVALGKEGFTVPDAESPQKDEERFTGTSSFGEPTASSVTGFQEKYKDEILTPSGLKNGTGYVGPATRKKLNQLYGCGIKSKVTQSSCEILKENECLANNECYALYQHYEIPPGPDRQFSNISPFNSYKSQKSNLLNCKKVINSFGTNTCMVDSISPSITVLSPNGGEQITKGVQRQITWHSSGISNQLVSISLVREINGMSNVVRDIATNISNTGSYPWIPQDIGTYKLIIMSGGKGNEINVVDSSDAAFSIVSQSDSITGTLKTDVQKVGITTNYGIEASGRLYYLFISSNAELRDQAGRVLQFSDLKTGMTAQVFGYPSTSFTDTWNISRVLILSTNPNTQPDIYAKSITSNTGYFLVNICNTGGTITGNAYVPSIITIVNGIRMPVSNYAYMSSDQAPVQPGSCGIVRHENSSFNLQANNTYNVVVTVDPSQEIAESNENNNTSSFSIIVGAATNSFVNVLSPVEGETLIIGSTRSIGWTASSDIVQVFIELVRSTTAEGGWIVATPPLSNTGTISWRVGDGYSRIGDSSLTAGNYYLAVRGRRSSDPAGSYPVFGYSKVLTVSN